MSDIHGDQQLFMDCLVMTGVIRWKEKGAEYDWVTGPEVEVVIIEDVVDGARHAGIDAFRKATEKTLLYTIGYFQRKSLAKNKRNGLIYCIGNHEIVNLFPFRFSIIDRVSRGSEYLERLANHYTKISLFVHEKELRAGSESDYGKQHVDNIINDPLQEKWKPYADFVNNMIDTLKNQYRYTSQTAYRINKSVFVPGRRIDTSVPSPGFFQKQIF